MAHVEAIGKGDSNMTAKENDTKPLDRNLAIECEVIDAMCVLELAGFALLNMSGKSENAGCANLLCALSTILEDERARLDEALGFSPCGE